jgi:hypothetical protein
MVWGRRLAWQSAQAPQLALCRHYGVTALSVRDALLPLVKNTDLVATLNDGNSQGGQEAGSTDGGLRVEAKLKKYHYPSAQLLCGVKVSLCVCPCLDFFCHLSWGHLLTPLFLRE